MCNDICEKIAKQITDSVKSIIDDGNYVEKTVVFKPIEISDDNTIEDVTKTIANNLSAIFKENNFDKCVLHISKAITDNVKSVTGTAGVTESCGISGTCGKTEKANSISGTISDDELIAFEKKEIKMGLHKISKKLKEVEEEFNDLFERYTTNKEKAKTENCTNKLANIIKENIEKINDTKEDYTAFEKYRRDRKNLSAPMLAAKLSRYNPEWVYGDCIKVANELLKNYTVTHK